MRPATVVLAVLLVVTGTAVVLTALGGSDAPGPTGSPAGGTVHTDRPSGEPGRTAEPEYDYPSADNVGSCFDPIYHRVDGSLLAMRLWDCDEPHLSELLGLDELDAPASAAWPGQRAVEREAETICRDIFKAYVGISFSASSVQMTFYLPNEGTWPNGDREVWCVADANPVAPFTSSVRNLRD